MFSINLAGSNSGLNQQNNVAYFLGKVYYYNAQTRATQWDKPEGPDVKILTQVRFLD